MREGGLIVLLFLTVMVSYRTIQQSFKIANIPSATWKLEENLGVG
jgi:hypothetical protein